MRHLGRDLWSFIGQNALWFCLLVTLIGAFLRFHELGVRSFWYDEAVEVLVARAPLVDLWSTSLARRLADPPLSTLLLHLMMRLGESEFILRFPYALLGSMAVYAGYHLFRLWLSPVGSLVPQALLAFAPAQVYYAQEVGQYVLIVLVSVLIIWSFERTLRRTNTRHLVLFTLFAGAGVLVHYGLYWLLGGLALTLLWRRKPRAWLAWWPAGVALTILTILIAVFIAWPQYQVLRSAYPPSPIFTGTELRSLYDSLSKTAHFFSDFGGRWDAPATPATWLFVAGFLFGVVIVLWKRAYRPVVAMFFIPMFLAYLASKAGSYLWGSRYLLFLSPLFYLLLGIGLVTVARVRPVGWLVPILALALFMINQMFVGWPNQERGEHLRPIVEQVQDLAAEDSSIYVYYGAGPGFEVYYNGNWDNVRLGVWFRGRPVEEQMADILPSFTGHTEAWFIASHYGEAEVQRIAEQLAQRCRPEETLRESNALAIRYVCEDR